MVTNGKGGVPDSADLFGYPRGDTLVEAEFTDAQEVVEFILAGRAKFTIRSEKTGTHYTFKVKKGDSQVWFVSRLTSENEYIYLGTIFPDGFVHTRKTNVFVRNSPQFRAFKWFWERLNEAHRIPRTIKFFHAGRCGACGAELTDPVSIKQGYGPECIKKRLRHGFMYDRKPA